MAYSAVSSGMLHVGVGQHEDADVVVEREAVDAMAGGQHHHGRRTVDGVAGRHLLDAGLQVASLVGGIDAFGQAQDGEDAADRDVDADIGRAVERIEQQQIAAVGAARHVGVFKLLGGDAGPVAALVDHVEEDVVGQNVQFLLLFALHVARAGVAHGAGHGAAVHFVGDRLAGGADVGHQRGEDAAAAEAALLLHQKERQGDASIGHGLSCRLPEGHAIGFIVAMNRKQASAIGSCLK